MSGHLRKRLLPALAGLGLAATASAQEATDPPIPAAVDHEGVLRWTSSGEEVALFGVNYSVPFAHGYRALGYVGADRRRAIDTDVAHFTRLGLDAWRIHVWDRQVSDRAGNLVENEHLELLDYLLARLAENGIRAILTPIAWWPAGYPEPDPGTDGLSDGWDKGGMTTDPEARAAQENYLAQFVAHRNPYTGLTVAEDPNVLAVEVINEPDHPGSPGETTAYIDAMAEALRGAGFRKPVFYNISQGYRDEHGHAVCAARIDGVSHQWYPTGLVRNGTIGGNMLPNVDRYTIPYANFPECRNKARMVYEFDAADVAGSYMYPAMARAFRGAGFQWATQFAYDPLAIAWANTEYQTHFLNLVYAPRKSISFMIAAEAFRSLPRGASFGRYPESERFGPFRVSYVDDRSEMVTDATFLYSNGSDTLPPAPSRLERVAGVGSSPVVAYDGTGPYFLDRLDEGVWRLELYPDVAWTADPFTRPSLEREAARVLRRVRRMRIELPDLGGAFDVRPLDPGNDHRPSVADGAFEAWPGAYLLTRSGIERSDWSGDTVVDGRPLGRFFAPAGSDAPTEVLHAPPAELEAGRPFRLRADVVAADPPDSVVLYVGRVGAWERIPPLALDPAEGFAWEAEIPATTLRPGLLEYRIVVFEQAGARTFPGGESGHPFRWDFTGRDGWRVTVVEPGAPVLLFDGAMDLEHMLHPHPWEYVRFRTGVVPGGEPGRLAVRAVVEDFTPVPHHFALRTFLPVTRRGRLADGAEGSVLRIRARSAGRSVERMELALVEQDGSAWGAVLELSDAWREITVPLADLAPAPLALLPRPYPQFLPYLLQPVAGRTAPDPARLDGLQFSVGAHLFEDGDPGPHGFEIERVVLDLLPGPSEPK